MKTTPSPPHVFRPGRHLEMFNNASDPYAQHGKLSEPTVCSECGAVYHQGRWQWLPAPADAKAVRCAACSRMLENMPAGYVALQGSFARDHRVELLELVRNLEAREKAEHPMQRIISIDEHDDGLTISTTDVHLARGIGEALHHAYKGTLDYQFHPDQYLLHVRWER
jgi:NMD protein affecting ribosome stability and mRNA decay